MVDEIIIKYESSSTSEITERQISSVSSKISNGKIFIAAYCHLREAVKNFTLNNILEIRINGTITDKDTFFYDNIKDKKKFIKELENTYVQKQNEYNNFLEFYKRIKSYG
jgi:predicted DNA-binding transcriptional regulator YafY